MDTINKEMLIKLFEWNKSGLITDADFAKLSKALLYENMAQKEVGNNDREEKIFETRKHTEELRERVEKIKAKKAKEQKVRKEKLYLSIILDRHGNRAFSFDTIKDLSDDEIIGLADDVRENNFDPKYKLLTEDEKKQFLELFIPEKDRKDFKFDYKFPKPKWMILNKNKNVKSKELTEEEIAAKKREIADKLYAESKKKDKERHSTEKTQDQDEVYVLPGKKNFNVDKVANIVNGESDRTKDINNMANFDNATTEKNRTNDIDNLANFDNTTKNKKDRTQDINNMASFNDKKNNITDNKTTDRTVDMENMAKYSDEIETKENSSRFVTAIRNIGSDIKNRSKIIAGGTMAIASLAAVILNPIFIAGIPAGALIGYAGKKIYDGRKGK